MTDSTPKWLVDAVRDAPAPPRAQNSPQKVQSPPQGKRVAQRRAQRALDQLGDGLDGREHLTHKTTAWARHQWERQGLGTADWSQTPHKAGRPGWNLFSRELYADLLEGGLEEVCEGDQPESAAWAREVHDQLDQLPEHEHLRRICKDDPAWSALGAAKVAQAVQDATDQEQRHDPDAVRDLAETQRELGDDAVADVLDQKADEQEALAAADAAGVEEQGLAVRQQVRAALRDATEQVDQARQAAQLLGLGAGDGTAPTGAHDPTEDDAKARIAKLVASCPDFARILEVAGRFLAAGRSALPEKVRPHVGEVVDVRLSDDVARLLPSEAARLADPLRAPGFYADLVEHKLATYEMEGDQDSQRGPVVFLRDRSVSMGWETGHSDVTPDLWSKGVMLATFAQLRRERRDMVVGHYDGDLVRWTEYLHPHQDVARFLAEFKVEPAGGTDLGAAMARAEGRTRSPRLETADYLIVTDGQDSRPGVLDAVRAEGRRVLGIFVGCGLPEWAPDLDLAVELHTDQLDGDDRSVARDIYSSL